IGVAHQWYWSEKRAQVLVANLRVYHQCHHPFAGGQADGLSWRENLPISAEEYPLKALAITLLSVVPHAGDVERLFSDMGSQSVKRCNLSVATFETITKIHANLRFHSHQKTLASGRPVCHRHAHMHTRDEPGIDLNTARNLENTFAFEPPLTIQSNNSDDLLTGPEDISVDEIDAEFDALEKQNVVERFKDVDIDGLEILEGNVYNFDELARVEAGMVPKSIDEE
ncbi:hypothetical protein EV702DRAFT_955637, partial [Suillus placidus]